MKKVEYRRHIHEMVDKVRSEKRLKQIYTVVHRLYLHDAAENGEEVHITDPEEMKGGYLFLRGLNGESV